ncbi:MAG: hypothetical protein BroJett030_12100 [Alphaproteobacteria bacterium]|nr:MAG: hypothetical protein BroJett030_12100 [Alphaproteobacteria bacterium]
MTTRTLHWLLLAIAVTGLAGGLAAAWADRQEEARIAWAAATLPVVGALAVFIIRDFLAGRVGVDAVALLSMSTAVVLGEPLAGVVVAIMYSGGNVLEAFARGRAEHNLRALADRTPRTAHRIDVSGLADIPVAAVRVGDELLVQAGEVIPVDGVVVAGQATIDQSALTGEPIPVRLGTGEALASGTVNAGEAMRMRTTAEADRSTYAGIVRMVETAQTARAPFIRMADRFALILLPVTIAVALLAWALSGDPVRALAVLVVATPCPLILAAPVALIAGVSRAARLGIVMKGAGPLEALARVRTAFLDKTGTLTGGGARISAVRTATGFGEDELLGLAASLEQASAHVVAEAIVAAARARGIELSHPDDVREQRGVGIEGRVAGRLVRVGGRSLVWGGRPLPGWAEPDDKPFVLTVFVAVDNALAGVILLMDAVRPEAGRTLRRLHAGGIGRIIMLTGDDGATARAVGSGLGLDTILAERSPAEKVDLVAAQAAREATLMVGDGINDAPALAAATVGIAMGARGATASSEAADIVILVERLDRVADAFAIARRSRAIAMQSIVAGLALSGLAMVAAALGHIPPVAGALLQEAIDVAVIANALRALGGPRDDAMHGVATAEKGAAAPDAAA